MSAPSHDFVTVDMRGLKAALVARAKAERVSVSVVVRRAVQRELAIAEEEFDPSPPYAVDDVRAVIKLSIRMTTTEAHQLVLGAKQAGLSRGAFLGGLLAGIPALSADGATRSDTLRALTVSNAELSTIVRDVRQVGAVAGQGDARAALECKATLEALSRDIRAHLKLAAGELAALRPTRGPSRGSGLQALARNRKGSS